MRTNKKVVKQLIKQTEERLEEMRLIHTRYIENLKTFSEVEDLVMAKQTFLLEILENLPLDGDDCYFCEYQDRKDAGCTTCPYVENHGVCDHDNSTYKTIRNKWKQLISLIVDTYYVNGERFKVRRKQCSKQS